MAELGWTWALATGYDIAFLYLVFAALENAPFETARCTALPFRKLRVRRLSEQHRRWVASFNILLIAEKCRDDVLDEGGWKGRLGLRVLSGQVVKAVQILEDSGFSVDLVQTLTPRQADLEKKPGLSLEHLAQPTSELLGEVFAHLAHLLDQGQRAPALRHLGQGLGAAIYFKDAADDLSRDRQRGTFNALAECVGPDWQPYLRGALQREHQRCLVGLENLALGQTDDRLARSILENLIPPSLMDESELEMPRPSPVRALKLRSRIRGTCDCGGCDCGGCDCGGCDSCGDCGGCDACCDCSTCPCDGCTCDGCASSTAKKNAPVEPPPSPTLPRLHCPACGYDLVSQTYSGVEIDECRKCKGLWLDHGELEILSELDSLPKRLFESRSAGRIALRPEGTRPCPRCSRFLVGHTVKGVRLDLCSDCQGVWLDQGELNQLLERPIE